MIDRAREQGSVDKALSRAIIGKQGVVLRQTLLAYLKKGGETALNACVSAIYSAACGA